MQKPIKMSFKDKIKMLFCARSMPEYENSPTAYRTSPTTRQRSGKKEKLIKKQPRQTLNMDDLFLKISRKNVVEEEFFTNTVLNLQTEKHINGRLKDCYVGILHGDFTDQSTKNLKSVIYLTEKPGRTLPYREQIKSRGILKLRINCVDVLVYQTSGFLHYSLLASDSKKRFQTLKTNQLSKPNKINDISIFSQTNRIMDEYSEILNVMAQYQGKADKFLIICSKYFESESITQQPNHPLSIGTTNLKKKMLQYTKNYMFQLQRIRENQQILCNLVYISKNASFLRIIDKWFKQYIISQMQMTMQEQSKITVIMDKLIELKYHCQILHALRSVKKESFATRSLFQPFIVRICGQNENIHDLVTSLKDHIYKHESIENTPVLIEPTPLFNIRLKSQTETPDQKDIEFQ